MVAAINFPRMESLVKNTHMMLDCISVRNQSNLLQNKMIDAVKTLNENRYAGDSESRKKCHQAMKAIAKMREFIAHVRLEFEQTNPFCNEEDFKIIEVPFLPESQKHKYEVGFLRGSSPWSVWVSHCDENITRKFEELLLKNASNLQEFEDLPVTGDYVLYKQGSQLRRVIILEHDVASKRFKIFEIDTGNTAYLVESPTFYKMDEEVGLIPYQALNCILIKDTGDQSLWNQMQAEDFIKTLKESKITIEIIGKINGSLTTYLVNMLAKRNNSTFDVGKLLRDIILPNLRIIANRKGEIHDTNPIMINNVPLMMNPNTPEQYLLPTTSMMRMPPPASMGIHPSALRKNNMAMHPNQSRENFALPLLPSAVSGTHVYEIKKQILKVRSADTLNAFCTFINSPNEFYVQIVSDSRTYSKILGNELEMFYSNCHSPDYQFVPGMEFCACKHICREDHGLMSRMSRFTWFRGHVVPTEDGDEALVHLVDFGKTVKKSFNELKVLDHRFYQYYEMAHRCHLHNVPTIKDKHVKEVTSYFKFFIERKGSIQQLKINVINYLPSRAHDLAVVVKVPGRGPIRITNINDEVIDCNEGWLRAEQREKDKLLEFPKN